MAFTANGNIITNPFVQRSDFMDIYPGLAGNIISPQLLTWGYNNVGQLGDNSVTFKSSPVQTIAGGTNWKQISCGKFCTAGIKTDGTLWGFGDNSTGQLSDNTQTYRSSPVQVIGNATNWKQVACGYLHNAAIKTDGTLWLAGYNTYGQLGDSSIIGRSSIVQTVATGTNWKQVACGQYHTAAIKTSGSVWTWGFNNAGQLGDSTLLMKSSPVQIYGDGSNWKQVACGWNHTGLILVGSGTATLFLTGNNNFGQLGDNTTVNKSAFTQITGTTWNKISLGRYHTAAIKTDGTLWTWGRNTEGQLGDNTAISKSSPIQTIAGGTNWKQVVACGYHTAAIKTDGTLWTWGNNSSGQLGDNTSTSKSSPIQTVVSGTNWKQVGGGMSHTAAIYDDTL